MIWSISHEPYVEFESHPIVRSETNDHTRIDKKKAKHTSTKESTARITKIIAAFFATRSFLPH